MSTHYKLKGEYKVVVNRGNQPVVETEWFDNLILNAGLDQLATTDYVTSFAQVGSGSTAPSPTQTSLTTWVASTTPTFYPQTKVNLGAPTYAAELTWRHEFAQGAVVATIAEVGCGWDASPSNSLFSRALIVDGSGNPITISVTAMDQLTVFYRVRITPVVTDTTGTINISGTPYSYTQRLLTADSFGTSDFGLYQMWLPQVAIAYDAGVALAPLTSAAMDGTLPALSDSPAGSVSTYTPGTYYRDCTFTWDPSSANGVGGVQGIEVRFGHNMDYRFQVLFNNPIPKNNTTQLTYTHRFSWSRA